MKQLRSLLKTLALSFVLASIAAPAPATTEPKPTIDLHKHPTAGKTPVDVSVGLYITNFVAIDETRENFEVGGYLSARWQDPRLALPPDQASKQPTRTFQLGDIWAPAIEAANSVTHKTNQSFMSVDPTGTVTYVERFDAVLSTDYDLRKFPFDSQVLRLEFQPFLSAASDIRFTPQPLPSTGISPEQHTDLAAWQLQDLRYTAEKVTSDRYFPAANEALFQIHVKRRSGFYLWKIFVPLAMMTLIPAVVFWIDVDQFDWLLKIPITMLLSMVAFELAISRDLPRIGYVTFLDAVFLASFTFYFLCTFEILLVYLLQKNGKRPTAERIHKAGRWAYPIAYFAVIFAVAVSFLA